MAMSLDRSEERSSAAIASRLADGLADEWGWSEPEDRAQALSTAETVVDLLVDSADLMPSDRWDEVCHDCGALVGDHLVRGGCP